MVRIALETCATVEEAIERFRSVRIWFPCEVNHLLIADEAGIAAIVEFDRERNMVTFRRTEPQMIMTNTAYQEGIEFIREHCPRFRMAQSVLEAKGRRAVSRPYAMSCGSCGSTMELFGQLILTFAGGRWISACGPRDSRSHTSLPSIRSKGRWKRSQPTRVHRSRRKRIRVFATRPALPR